nr:MAG TPA: hypothetical protein [Caudoviricetes sp.]
MLNLQKHIAIIRFILLSINVSIQTVNFLIELFYTNAVIDLATKTINCILNSYFVLCSACSLI